MKIGSFTIKNYRCFNLNNPISFDIEDGITFILGVNNIGKSSILRSLVDFKSAFTFEREFERDTSIAFPLQSGNYKELIHQASKVEDIFIEITEDDILYKLKLSESIDSSQFLVFSDFDDTNFHNTEFEKMKSVLSESIYIGPTRAISANISGNAYNLIHGTNLINKWELWFRGEEPKKRQAIKDLVNEIREIFNYTRLAINPNHEKSDFIIENDTGSFLLSNMGEGIAQIIIALANATFNRPSFIFIDEPENSLHPQLQQKLVLSLARKCKVGLLATSHSIGLARSCADRIYTLQKSSRSNKRIVLPYGENFKATIASSISELGYSQFCEIGGNNILLVEGRTDIKFYREILRKYNLDSFYILMDLGGSINGDTKDELSEIKRLNPNSISVIIDSDKTSEDDPLSQNVVAFVNICKELDYHIFLTEGPSTENYITQSAIDNSELGKHKALETFEKFENQWPKNKNWKFAQNISLEDLQYTKLKKFITDVLATNKDVV